MHLCAHPHGLRWCDVGVGIFLCWSVGGASSIVQLLATSICSCWPPHPEQSGAVVVAAVPQHVVLHCGCVCRTHPRGHHGINLHVCLLDFVPLQLVAGCCIQPLGRLTSLAENSTACGAHACHALVLCVSCTTSLCLIGSVWYMLDIVPFRQLVRQQLSLLDGVCSVRHGHAFHQHLVCCHCCGAAELKCIWSAVATPANCSPELLGCVGKCVEPSRSRNPKRAW